MGIYRYKPPAKTLRKYLISAWIVIWLAIQILVPLFRKFDLPHLRYRYATFSWAMYSKPALLYDVSLFRINPLGQKESIPHIEQFVRGTHSPQPMRMREYYRSETEIKERLTRLVAHIARHEPDHDRRIGVSVQWIRKLSPEEPVRWDFCTDAKGRS